MQNKNRGLILAAALLGGGGISVQAQPGRPPKNTILLGYVREYQLEMLVGQYDPATHRWYPNTVPFTPPKVQTPFSLFGEYGKLAEVRLDETYRSPRDVQPWEWNVAISSWSRAGTSVALGLSGFWPDVSRPVESLPVDPDITAAVVDFLKRHGLDVPNPRITQVLSADLNADGQLETLICANSDNTAITDADPAAIYSLSLIRVNDGGHAHILPLRTTMAYKPAHRSLDEYQRLHGRVGYFQVLGITDIARNGQEQVAILNDNRSEGPEIDLYGLPAGSAKAEHLLSVRKLYQ